ncbi:low affinity immunoglobulin gamma Fc region receptor III-B-like isoform X3 [Ochotona curzoniae]|uniref:low affinity immunoglobulin gamma Fc region receptor III-B-like isoform X3 n=1 Tax=Ochotona curzoniae TaxID=130825 RepID=UPI001B34864E|nr:low affinity immunoglobulin gamma Fc region receptor III-B-like isoform X3 [Ochotona curzoniae]
MGQLLSPVALLLLVSAASRAAEVLKPVVLLDPPWDRVLQEDRVTLKCQGFPPAANSSIQWLHNGSLISSHTPTYTIRSARAEDSGEYRCGTNISNLSFNISSNISSLSDPVQLQVRVGWLVLQAARWVIQEGEPIHLRCHSWRNKCVQKVTYLHADGRGVKYFHNNTDLHIPEAKHTFSGSYFCRGLVGKKNVSSETVIITVQANASISPSVLSWHLIAFGLVMGLLLAVDTALYFSVKRDLRSSLNTRKDYTFGWSKDILDK